MSKTKAALFFLAAFMLAGHLHADEVAFLKTLEGNWRGSGEVRLKPESSSVDVSCTLKSNASGTSVVMDGQCTGLLIFSRPLSASLQAEGNSYSGSYVGSPRGTANLSGNRKGETLDLHVQWPNQSARMELASPGNGQMQIGTIETHPKTGEPVVTVQIALVRE